MLSEHDIESRWGFHKATVEGKDATTPKHTDLRIAFKDFVSYLNTILPEGRYKDLAMDDLERVSMWTHKSIAETAPLAQE
jgi:hypothetical protein